MEFTALARTLKTEFISEGKAWLGLLPRLRPIKRGCGYMTSILPRKVPIGLTGDTPHSSRM